jgi:hypothetical protein
MAVIRYDKIKRSGAGRIYSPALEGELELSFLGLILDDLAGDDFKPLVSSSPNAYATIFERLLWISPFLRVTAGSELYPFSGTPEARYRLGSYSFILGYTSEETRPGTFVFTPVPTEPTFINYKVKALTPTWFQYAYPRPSKLDYDIKFAAVSENLTDIYFKSKRQLGAVSKPEPFIDSPLHQGILLNLNPGVVADFAMYYTWENRNAILPGEDGNITYYPY